MQIVKRKKYAKLNAKSSGSTDSVCMILTSDTIIKDLYFLQGAKEKSPESLQLYSFNYETDWTHSCVDSREHNFNLCTLPRF